MMVPCPFVFNLPACGFELNVLLPARPTWSSGLEICVGRAAFPTALSFPEYAMPFVILLLGCVLEAAVTFLFATTFEFAVAEGVGVAPGAFVTGWPAARLLKNEDAACASLVDIIVLTGGKDVGCDGATLTGVVCKDGPGCLGAAPDDSADCSTAIGVTGCHFDVVDWLSRMQSRRS
jgi:hypothetical protein